MEKDFQNNKSWQNGVGKTQETKERYSMFDMPT